MTSPETSNAATRILSALLEARTGQQLSPARNWRIEASLKPVLRELGLATLDPLVARLQVHCLSDQDVLWGRAVEDERYAVVATAA